LGSPVSGETGVQSGRSDAAGFRALLSVGPGKGAGDGGADRLVAGSRGSEQDRAGSGKSGLQCPEIHVKRENRSSGDEAQRGSEGGGGGYRDRDSGRASPPSLRTVLPDRQGAVP